MSAPVLWRFAAAILISWIAATVIALTLPIPESSLVGQSTARSTGYAAENFLPPDIDAANKALEKVLMWGVLRDGQPIPPPVKEEPRKKIEWRLVATALRPGERYIMIQTAGQAPVQVKEGAELPDGSRLLKVEPKAITLRLENGKKHKQPTVFD